MCDDFGWEKTSDTWSLTASKKLSDTKVYYADGVVYSDYFYVYGLILFNNDYDVLWNRVSVNELIEEDPVDPGKKIRVPIIPERSLRIRMITSSSRLYTRMTFMHE